MTIVFIWQQGVNNVFYQMCIIEFSMDDTDDVAGVVTNMCMSLKYFMTHDSDERQLVLDRRKY